MNEKNIKEKNIVSIVTDLTEQARNHKLNPVIGRDDEILRVIEILSRKDKNNPILIGEPGVGKTAVIEGIAQRIVSGNVPPVLKGVTILSLNLVSLISGSSYVGQLENNLNNLIKELNDSCGSKILFIDEIHNIANVGSSMKVAEILKPALARGEIKCVGATTFNEYKKYIEIDPALDRRFQRVIVNEPSRDETISILRGLKKKYESYHNVKILDEAVEAAVDLSTRYVTGKFLPDKALDLLDETAASLKIENITDGAECAKTEQRIYQIKQELDSLKSDNTDEASTKADVLKKELSDLRDKLSSIQAQKDIADKSDVSMLRSEINNRKKELADAKTNKEIEKVAELQYTIIPELESKYEALCKNKDVDDVVNKECVIKTVAKKTGINVTQMMTSEKDKILNLNKIMSERVIGQDEALKLVSNAILRAKADIQDENKPLGSFLFLGPTGVGKTEVAKTLAEQLFGSDNKILRFDMSEYSEKSGAQNLIGAAAGYVGYENGGTLTNAVKNNPYSIVLFDEIEKAHPDVFNILLQILDEGRLTDNRGDVVNFKNVLVIMTSNLGAANASIEDKIKRDIAYKNDVSKFLKPEIVNRIDEVIVFNKLNDECMAKIAMKFINLLKDRLAKKGVSLSFTDAAINQIIKEGTDINYGARPLKRHLQSYIEPELATIVIETDAKGGTIVVDYNGSYLFSLK